MAQPTNGILVLKDGVQSGPFDQRQLQSMVQAGLIARNDHAWAQGMPEWREVWEVAGISPPPPATRGGTALEGRSRLPRTKIKSHLGFSIFIVLVSFPLGIVPLVYSLRTRRLLREGDLVAAKKSSKSAENWGVTLFVIAMIFFGLNAFVVATRL